MGKFLCAAGATDYRVFKDRTIGVIQEYTSIHDIDMTSLESKLLQQQVNNHNDRRMVRESIHFIRDQLKGYDYNIFNWSFDTIQTHHCAEAYQVLDGIHAIGDKLACFYLRDVALVSDLEATIRSEEYHYFQPIDTWVKQVTEAIGITGKADQNLLVVKEKIIASCVEVKVSPLLFNAGAWMMGANAFRLILERL